MDSFIGMISADSANIVHIKLNLKKYERLLDPDNMYKYIEQKRAINFYHKYGFEFDGCKKEWTLGTPITIVRMVMKRA